MKSRLVFTSILSGLLVFSFAPANADAATILVECEKRPFRSKVSVNGNNLPRGRYRAVIISGANQKISRRQNTIRDEVEFDFDSDPDDIAAGANPIGPNFIRRYRINTAKIQRIVNNVPRTVIVDTAITCDRG
jgi:hypothetical protein